MYRLKTIAANGIPGSPFEWGGVAVDQGLVHGWSISYNPDDDRFYVERKDGIAAATFKRWSNAVSWAKAHKPK